MINITKYENNEFVLYLNQDLTLVDPYFIFEFEDSNNRIVITSLVDDASMVTSYNLFNFYESSTATLNASGSFNVYESSTNTVDITGLNLLTNSIYKLNKPGIKTTVFDPSINKVYVVFDPSSNWNI